MDGGSQYVDLGNWAGDTCFVDVPSCEQGRHFLDSVQLPFKLASFEFSRHAVFGIFPLGPLFAQPLSNKQQTTGSSFTGINIIY